MGRYLIADFVVEIQNKHEYITHLCADYKYVGERETDFTVCVTEQELERERTSSGAEYSDGYIESICAYRKLCLMLPMRDAVLLHGSVVSCGERGIAFLAQSGVGKTTHTLLWTKVYPEAVIINGDKPIIRLIDGVPYAYGTPWSGKERLGCNSRVRLTDVCFINRSEANSVQPACDFTEPLFCQILRPSAPDAALKTLALADMLTKKCRFLQINCNASVDAAVTAHDYIFKEDFNEA